MIVNTSSDAACDGASGMTAHAGTKAEIIALTLPAAREFAGRGVRLNTIVAGGSAAHIVENGYINAAALRIDAGYRIQL